MNEDVQDGGFALLDALMGAVILSFAGTVALMVGNGALARSDADLDHSVVLLTLESLVTEARFRTADNISQGLPKTIGAFSYDLTRNDIPAIVAYRTNSDSVVLSFDLLAGLAP